MTPLIDIHAASPQIDAALLGRFDRSGPRYTSYPAAECFDVTFDANAYRAALRSRNNTPGAKALSLYIRAPCCDALCGSWGRNSVATRDHGRAARYLACLDCEIDLVDAALGGERKVQGFHWGGGTASFLAHDELRELAGMLRSRFDLVPGGELSIEIDPSSSDAITVQLLAELGFNHLSLGVQDFHPDVQHAVNRRQSVDRTLVVVDAAREHCFKSVGFELAYGLPRQTLERFAATLALVLALAPDRVALHGYEHLPVLFERQRRITESELPDARMRVELLRLGIETLTGAGYVHIGMDDFTRPHDELAVAERRGCLQRNLHGYSTRAERDLIGFGVSARSAIGRANSQNITTLSEYYACLERKELPVARGIVLQVDDLVRRAVIHAVMCHGELVYEAIEQAFFTDFTHYFATELRELARLAELGLVEMDREGFRLTACGRMFMRPVAMVFDRYARTTTKTRRYAARR